MNRKNENFSELIREQNEAYDELLAQDLAERETFAALERRMSAADDLLGPEPELEAEQANPGIVVIRIYTSQGCVRRRFRAKSPDGLLSAIHLYLESLGHFEEDNPVLSTFDRVITTQDLKNFLAKGGGALYLNKRPRQQPPSPK